MEPRNVWPKSIAKTLKLLNVISIWFGQLFNFPQYLFRLFTSHRRFVLHLTQIYTTKIDETYLYCKQLDLIHGFKIISTNNSKGNKGKIITDLSLSCHEDV